MKNESTYDRILVIQTAFIGDVILTTPMIRALRQLYPAACIDVLVIPQTADILASDPDINNIILFDKRANKHASQKEVLALIKKNSYDFGISPHRSLTSALFMWQGGIRRRIGFDGPFHARLYTDRVRWPRLLPERERNLMLLKPLSGEKFSADTHIFFNIGALLAARDFDRTVSQKSFRIAIAPGSVWPTKRWPEEYFVQLVKKLQREDYFLVFIGGKEERQLCERIIKNADARNALNLAGRTTLTEAAAIIERCDLFIGNDSGTMHMANAVHTDVLTFFGPTVPSLGFAPYRPRDTIFQVSLPCRPCSLHGGRRCPRGHFRCMRAIKPDAVYLEVLSRAIRHRLQPKRQLSSVFA